MAQYGFWSGENFTYYEWFLYEEPPVDLHFWTFPLFTGSQDCQGHFLFDQVVIQPESFFKGTALLEKGSETHRFLPKEIPIFLSSACFKYVSLNIIPFIIQTLLIHSKEIQSQIKVFKQIFLRSALFKFDLF